jgi:hypothetical protein
MENKRQELENLVGAEESTRLVVERVMKQEGKKQGRNRKQLRNKPRGKKQLRSKPKGRKQLRSKPKGRKQGGNQHAK